MLDHTYSISHVAMLNKQYLQLDLERMQSVLQQEVLGL